MSEADSAFRIGDRVRVKAANPDGNPRTPAYVRGKTGIVTVVHGCIDNPVDHRGIYPTLYTVEFELREVFGTNSSDRIAADVHEDWLDPL